MYRSSRLRTRFVEQAERDNAGLHEPSPFGYSCNVGPSTPKSHVFTVLAEWDEEARVWVATRPDIPGLVTEANTHEQLVAKLNVMVPEMLDENGSVRPQDGLPEVPFTIMSQHVARGTRAHG